MAKLTVLGAIALLAVSGASTAQEGDWAVYSRDDRMTGEKTTIASVRTTELFQLKFPYNKARQTAELQLRAHPRHGNDVIFSIQEGQLVCGPSRCPVRIRFDESAPTVVNGSGPADGSSETIFIPGFDRIAKRMATASTVLIEVDVYQHGSMVFEFNVAGFDESQFR